MSTVITDEMMRAGLGQTKPYTLVILKKTPQRAAPGGDKIIWEHGRRNFMLRADKLLAIVCPVRDDSDIAGVSVFNVSTSEAAAIMNDDPAVRAGVLTYEVHECRSFPGDSLP